MSRIKSELEKLASPRKAKVLQGFFKTGSGQYGEGDVFLGVAVPDSRRLVKKFSGISLKEIESSLSSKIHEERLVALLVLVEKYSKASEKEKDCLFDFYLSHSKSINNWDLVDLTAPKIVGEHLLHGGRGILYRLAKSNDLWERRISVLSTFTFIRNNDFSDALKISEILLKDKHDLIHKAVGWMLREIGKRDLATEEGFLKKHSGKMPRTMLRYAIEKFPEKKRKEYLAFSG